MFENGNFVGQIYQVLNKFVGQKCIQIMLSKNKKPKRPSTVDMLQINTPHQHFYGAVTRACHLVSRPSCKKS
jgi:hypothetical protein